MEGIVHNAKDVFPPIRPGGLATGCTGLHPPAIMYISFAAGEGRVLSEELGQGVTASSLHSFELSRHFNRPLELPVDVLFLFFPFMLAGQAVG